MTNLLKVLWAKIREVVEVLVVGSIITALGIGTAMIKFDLMSQRAFSFQSDPTQPGLLEISVTTLSRLETFWDSGIALMLFISVFPNVFAIYYSAKNDELLLSIRLILTGENVQRLVYTIIQMAGQLCTVFLNTGCARDGFAGFIFGKFSSLFVVNAFCQMFVSFSRFMAVSFDGIFFRHTKKHTLLQFIICYSMAISLFCLSMFQNISQIVNLYLTPTLTYFMLTTDFFTFLKLRKMSKSKVSTAERRLMVQMIGNSAYYFMNYFASSLITIVQYPFFGYFLMNVGLQLNAAVSKFLYAFGLSYLNMVYLRKKVLSLGEKETYNSTSSRSVKSKMAINPKSSNSTPKI